MYRIIVLILVGMVVFLSPVFSAQVELKSGKTFSADIVFVDETAVRFNVSGVALEYDKVDIAKINSLSLEEYLLEKKALSYQGVIDSYRKGLSSGCRKDFIAAKKYLSQGLMRNKYEIEFETALELINQVEANTINSEVAVSAFKGLNFLNDNQVDKALVVFKDLVKTSADAWLLDYLLAKTFFLIKDFKNAGIYYLKSSQSNSENFKLLYFTALCDIELNKNKEAIISLNKVIQKSSSFVAAYTALGRAYTAMGKPQFALPYYKKALEIDLLSPQVYFDLGEAYFNLGEAQPAGEYLRKALELYREKKDKVGEEKTRKFLDKVVSY